jgi:hypothetical protein
MKLAGGYHETERFSSKILNISLGSRAVNGGLPEDNENQDLNAKAQREMKAAKLTNEPLQDFSLRLGS